MRDKAVTIDYYVNKLGFEIFGSSDYDDYLMLKKEGIEIHFFKFEALIPQQNYGQVYLRANNISNLYQTWLDHKVKIHPNGQLQLKPWGQREFSLLDPDSNLLTFGETATSL